MAEDIFEEFEKLKEVSPREIQDLENIHSFFINTIKWFFITAVISLPFLYSSLLLGQKELATNLSYIGLFVGAISIIPGILGAISFIYIFIRVLKGNNQSIRVYFYTSKAIELYRNNEYDKIPDELSKIENAMNSAVSRDSAKFRNYIQKLENAENKESAVEKSFELFVEALYERISDGQNTIDRAISGIDKAEPEKRNLIDTIRDKISLINLEDKGTVVLLLFIVFAVSIILYQIIQGNGLDIEVLATIVVAGFTLLMNYLVTRDG
jgi:hypothetical protein